MTNRLALLLLLSSLSLPVRAAEDKDPFKIVHVTDLAAALKSERAPTVCDANSKGTRKMAGVIPGAVLLSSTKFDVAKELPADKSKPLVFYCANTMCMASHEAAKRALKAGYADVSILPEGIQGWKDAGQPVAPAKKKG
jgi:rhodanese-related sulfurtransferase